MSDADRKRLRIIGEHIGTKIIKQLEDGTIIAVMPFLYTVGLVYGLDENGNQGRFCYPDMQQALTAYTETTEKLTMAQPHYQMAFVKHKGRIEYTPAQAQAIWEHCVCNGSAATGVAKEFDMDPANCHALANMMQSQYYKHWQDIAVAWGWHQ